MRELVLDHLTAPGATPVELIAAAREAGFGGVGLFLRGMREVAGMADYDLVADPGARRACRRAAEDAGCAIAIAYPFTVSRQSSVADFLPSLDAAAELGAKAVNLLVFDHEAARRAEIVGAVSSEAASRRIQPSVEFFPSSAVPGFVDAVALCDAVGGDALKITVDLLHVHRSGSSLTQIAVHRARLALLQLCDAPAAAPADLFAEASQARLLPGEGDLDCRALLDACGPDVAVSVEVPSVEAAALSPGALARRAFGHVTCMMDGAAVAPTERLPWRAP